MAELRRESPDVDRWWGEHRVYQRTYGTKRLRHPVVGHLSVEYETLTPPGDPDTTLFLYSTAAGSPSREAMDVLASWALSDRTTGDRAAQDGS
nr:hypothetical protein [Pseudonocardia sp. HH130629-09]